MYVRKKSTKRNPNTYVQLVESIRVDGKVKQRVVKHIGTSTNDEEHNGLIQIANAVKKLYAEYAEESEIDKYIEKEISKLKGTKSQILNCQEVKRINTSIHEIYGTIYDGIGLNKIVKSKSNYDEIIKDIVMGRILSPGSKRFTCELLDEYFDIKHPLNSIYRAMDKLDEKAIENMQFKISEYTKNILNEEIKILFYDATSLYFESFTEDELKKIGYSKDGKFNQPQLILTLLVTNEGLPLNYQLFPGNTYEGHTLITAMKYWKNQYPNNKFVLVADSGLLNDINLNYLDKEGIDYIVCARLKNLPTKTKELILSKELNITKAKENFAEIEFKHRKLIVSYKGSRAKKDERDRDTAIKKLEKKLKSSKHPSSLINNYGYKKYITINSTSNVVINEEKISIDAKWDGLHGIITSLKKQSPEEVYSKYRGLWQIEDAFRINKHDLKIRPIFHWTPNRIKSHIAISYMAYSCYKHVEYKVNKSTLLMSHRQIKSVLEKVQASIFEDIFTKEKFFMPSQISKEAIEIYKIMDLKPPNEAYCCTLERKAS